MSTSQTLAEDFARLGIKDTAQVFALAGLTESGAADAVAAAPAPNPSSLPEVAEAICRGTMEQLQDNEIEGDRQQFESELRANIKARLEKEVAAGASLKEAGDTVATVLIEKMMKVRDRRIRITSTGKRIRFVANRKRGAEAVQAKREYRRWKARGGAKRKARAERRAPRLRQKMMAARFRSANESVATSLRAMLHESSIGDADQLSPVFADILEAHDRVASTASLLADFFEADGDDADKALVAVLDEMVQAIDARETAILEGKADESAELKRLGTFMKVLAGAVDQFEQYELVGN